MTEKRRDSAIGAIGSIGGFGRPRGRSQAAPAGRRPLRAVIFDMDGVLVDSFDCMRQAFEIAYHETVGPGEAPFAEYNRHLGRYFPEIMEIMGLPQGMQEPFVRESYRLAPQVQMFDGAREMVAGVRGRGLMTAVATGKSGDRARSLLSLLGMLDQFDHVIGGDEVPHAKPAPDMVLRALDLLGVEPQETFMVGDAASDIISARGASVAAVAATWGEGDRETLLAHQPDAVLGAPSDVLNFCETWDYTVQFGDLSAG
jgi:3-amino-5-hydroxybenzoic acid synthesis related protein